MGLLSSCGSGYCRVEDSLCGDSLLADFDAAALVEGAKQLLSAASDALNSIGIDVEAIGKALVQIGSDIEDLFDKKAKKRKEDEKAAKIQEEKDAKAAKKAAEEAKKAREEAVKADETRQAEILVKT